MKSKSPTEGTLSDTFTERDVIRLFREGRLQGWPGTLEETLEAFRAVKDLPVREVRELAGSEDQHSLTVFPVIQKPNQKAL